MAVVQRALDYAYLTGDGVAKSDTVCSKWRPLMRMAAPIIIWASCMNRVLACRLRSKSRLDIPESYRLWGGQCPKGAATGGSKALAIAVGEALFAGDRCAFRFLKT